MVVFKDLLFVPHTTCRKCSNLTYAYFSKWVGEKPPTGSNMWIHRVCCFYMSPTLDHGWYISIPCKKRRQISDGGFAPHLLWQGFKTMVNLFMVMFIGATFIAKSEINGDPHSFLTMIFEIFFQNPTNLSHIYDEQL